MLPSHQDVNQLLSKISNQHSRYGNDGKYQEDDYGKE